MANPDVYLDFLPQPYRFINKCLDQLIMKPVFNKITVIEERRKTPEYEGNIKEVQATGYMNINGVTAIGKMSQVALAGGLVEKSPKNGGPSNYNGGVQQKMIVGDKFGAVHLIDVSRKMIMDKIEIAGYKSRRILNIATASLEWVDTRLIYAAIVARASPTIHIVCFKHNDNKFRHLYSLNMCPTLENPDELENNEG